MDGAMEGSITWGSRKGREDVGYGFSDRISIPTKQMNFPYKHTS